MIEIGADIQETGSFDRRDSTFLDKVFTKDEISYCESKGAPAEHYAARFAAKEAVIKALSKFGETLNYKDIEILIKDKKPYIKIGKALKESYRFSVSLSHSGKYALANVLAENGQIK